jgi:hypothetical protein
MTTSTGDTAAQEHERLNLVRAQVKDILLKSDAFRRLPQDQQRDIARHTVEIAHYLATPEGIPGNTLAGPADPPRPRDPYALGLDNSSDPNRDLAQFNQATGGGTGFKAGAAREGAAVAGLLLRQVNFVQFVSGLIQGVFHSIVEASIQQMQAYGALVQQVAQTLSQFRDANVTENNARDHLANQFPDVFAINIDGSSDDGTPQPRLALRDGVDGTAALKKVNNELQLTGSDQVTGLDDDVAEQKLVLAARNQLAAQRQQLLATIVLMGINRIIVTDGRISAKVIYDFQAQDNLQRQMVASRYDYGNQYNTSSSSQTESGGGTGGSSGDSGGYGDSARTDGSYYTKGTYQYQQTPVVTLAATAQSTTDAELQSKATLSGLVDVHFKSETFPLEKMADSFQIARLQSAANPANRNPGGGDGGSFPAPSTGGSAGAPAASSAPSPTPTHA